MQSLTKALSLRFQIKFKNRFNLPTFVIPSPFNEVYTKHRLKQDINMHPERCPESLTHVYVPGKLGMGILICLKFSMCLNTFLNQDLKETEQFACL